MAPAVAEAECGTAGRQKRLPLWAETKVVIPPDMEEGGEQQPRPQGKGRFRASKGMPPLLRKQRQDDFSISVYVLAGKKIQLHAKIIPKNAPESKEGEPARSL